MLIECNHTTGHYVIAFNNASNSAELISDFSYLNNVPPGTLTFDFTHMALGLTQEIREEYLPGNFGFQPTIFLLEILSTLASYTEQAALCPHKLFAFLPNQNSRVGRFLMEMGIPSHLRCMHIPFSFTPPRNVEVGQDDTTRKSLIPLTILNVSQQGPNFAVLNQVIRQAQRIFTQALSRTPQFIRLYTSIIEEAIDNLLEYGLGGMIGGLYYPKSGEVEITLVNHKGSFGGTTPEEELEALVETCEGKTSRKQGGGTGIVNLSRLALVTFGTLLLRNGHATLKFLPDGSIVTTQDMTGLPLPGVYVTLLLQFLPTEWLARTEEMRQFESILEQWLQTYARISLPRMAQI